MFNSKFSILRPRLVQYLSKSYGSSRKCEEYTDLTRPLIVTLTGANARVGRITALMLKQSPNIDELRLFDYAPGVCGTAMDLSHIDTSTPIKAYTGINMLRDAVEDAKIVVICGGDATKPSHSEYELFNSNADYVRNIALHTAEFNPKTIICVASPPITAMVPLISEEYKKAKVYDARRIIGVMSLSLIRANAIIGAYTDTDPAKIMCPIIGAAGEKTTVAVVSQTKIGATLPSPIAQVLRNKVANAETEVLNFKYVENAGPCAVSTGFAIARFVNSVVRGVLGLFDGVECAFVRQTGELEKFLPYMGTVVKLGRYGIQSVHMPVIDNFECSQLQRATGTIQDQIRWGEDYITGVTTKHKRRCIRTVSKKSCSVIKIKNVKRVGDVAFDPSSEEYKDVGKLVPVCPHH